MTVIDELLVYLDDGQQRTLDECAFALPARTRQTLSSTLGRLTAKGWVTTDRDSLRRVRTYSITDGGQKVVTDTLTHLKIAGDADWDGRWLFVLFNIPERQRKYRDILRNRLTAVGFGRVQNSLWVTARDVSFELEELLGNEHIRRSVTLLRPQLDDAEAKRLANAFEWDWEQLNTEYAAFVETATAYLKTREHDPLAARLLVYHYAKLLAQDPKFPAKYEPRAYLRGKAHGLYLKLRPYCYEG